MRDFDLGGRDELENSFDKEIKYRQLLESKSCQDCRQNKNTQIRIFGAIFRQETEFYFCLLSQNVQGKIVTRNQFQVGT